MGRERERGNVRERPRKREVVLVSVWMIKNSPAVTLMTRPPPAAHGLATRASLQKRMHHLDGHGPPEVIMFPCVLAPLHVRVS